MVVVMTVPAGIDGATDMNGMGPSSSHTTKMATSPLRYAVRTT